MRFNKLLATNLILFSFFLLHAQGPPQIIVEDAEVRANGDASIVLYRSGTSGGGGSLSSYFNSTGSAVSNLDYSYASLNEFLPQPAGNCGVYGITTGLGSNGFGVIGAYGEDIYIPDRWAALGTEDAAIRIVDGTQQDGFILTSDFQGNGSWQAPKSDFTNFSLTDGSQQAGYIMTSDENGNGTWQAVFNNSNVFTLTDGSEELGHVLTSDENGGGTWVKPSSYFNDWLTIEHPTGFASGGFRIQNEDSQSFWQFYVDGSTDTNSSFYGDLYLLFNSTATQKAIIDSPSGNYIPGSDSKLKKNITKTSNLLDKIMDINPVQYNFKEQPEGAKKYNGFIAQELLKVFPDIVHSNSTGDQYFVSYTEMIPILTKGMQEQQDKLEKQDRQILNLVEIIAKQNKRLSDLEALIK